MSFLEELFEELAFVSQLYQKQLILPNSFSTNI